MMRTFLALVAALAVASARKCSDSAQPDCSGYYEMSCPLGHDEYGCDLGSVCVDSIGPMRCPVNCPCLEHELQCDDIVGDLECPSFYCIPNAVGPYDCPAYCPPNCDYNMQETCPGQKLTPDGCRDADYCAPYGQCMYDQEGCPFVDEPNCSPDQYFCDYEYDAAGCRMPGSEVCVGYDEECPEPATQPNGCPTEQYAECPDGQMRCEDMLGTVYDYYVSERTYLCARIVNVVLENYLLLL